jgi:hypothetical protein
MGAAAELEDVPFPAKKVLMSLGSDPRSIDMEFLVGLAICKGDEWNKFAMKSSSKNL